MLSNDINQCNKCPLCKTLPEGVVPLAGQGKIGAAFLLVEHPTIDNMVLEDYSVTLAQKMLDKFLNDAGIKNFYITSAVKCYSEKTYKKKEVVACSSWIAKELEEVKPRCIITFGSLPLQSIGTTKKLKEIVYESMTYNQTGPNPFSIPLFVNYSPNYLLQNSTKKYNEAVSKTRKFLENLNNDKN
jgi:uracil-DNA glycosylase family 4